MREWPVDELGPATGRLGEHRPDRLGYILTVLDGRDFDAMGLVRHPLQRCTPDEVIIELDDVAVPEIPRGKIGALDIR